MKNHACCTVAAARLSGQANKTADGNTHPPSSAGRSFKFARWSVPTLILAVLPKCPVCLAAYLALGTGVSLSVATASLFRISVVSLCVAMLIWALVSTCRKAPINRLLPGNRI